MTSTPDFSNSRDPEFVPFDSADDESKLSARELVSVLRPYGRVIGGTLAALLVCAVLAGSIAYLWTPTERVGAIQFRLLFTGAEDGKYPNGMPFNAAEIVGTSVLETVYGANDLRRFNSYESFKNAIFILPANPEVMLLEAQYQARLSVSPLPAPERARLEEEFRRKRESLKDPVFALSMRRSERFTSMPAVLIAKTLNDILSMWAKQVVDQKGVTLYNVPVLSRNVINADVLENDEYLIGVDSLRITAKRIAEVLASLQKLPGADIIRTREEQVSLAEIRTSVEDVQRFQLDPLLELVRSEGISKDSRFLSRYVSSQLFALGLKRQTAVAHVKASEEALQDYTTSAQRGSRPGEPKPGSGSVDTSRFGDGTVIPQLSESFLDRLLQLSTKNETSDVQYRQRLTNDILTEKRELAAIAEETAYYEGLEAKGRAAVTVSPATIESAKARLQRASKAIAMALDRTLSLYRDLSGQNLSPATMLYTITGPFRVTTIRSASVGTIAIGFLLILIVSAVAVPGACLFHYRLTGGANVRHPGSGADASPQAAGKTVQPT
jgi:hypothetical protein